VNLLLAIAAVWIVIGVYRLVGLQPKTAMIGLIFFGLAFVYSVYGIWNADHPQIKNITVTIPHVPSQWKNKKIVQLSDVHLGHVHRSDFLRRIVAQVNAVHPDMVVITGDFFDGMDGDMQRLVQPLSDLGPVKGTFFITGNHEMFLGMDKVFAAFQNTRVQILQDQVLDIDGLKVIGISYPRRGEKKDVVGVLHSLEKDFAGRPNLFLFHAPVHIDEFINSGVNLQLSGHTHRGQIFPFCYITELVYKGYDYGLHQMGDYTLYTTNGAGTWGPAMRTGNIPEVVVVTLQ
jgi:predicted MPP superfamily phosphohydrolase